VKSIAAIESMGHDQGMASPSANGGAPSPVHGPAARWWLRQFFRLARNAPWVLAALRPLAVRLTIRCSPKVRDATAANARRILGAHLTDRQCRAFGRRVVASFYDFVADVGRCADMTAEELRARIETIEGKYRYAEHRRRDRRGAIIITAHMGSFEVGLASLLDVEQNMHVVYKRDAMDQFETIRRGLRQALGVREAAIDDGWGTWMALRDALAADHVVLMQADRAMPGQKAQPVPMLGGHVMLPLGPVRLAEITGSPIVPVFALRTGGGRCRVIAEDPIWVDRAAEPVNGVHPTLLALGKVIERYIVAHPEQWLVLDKAFVEDSS
jgi:KDO2-lipid IV(A) lauroyltransferase